MATRIFETVNGSFSLTLYGASPGICCIQITDLKFFDKYESTGHVRHIEKDDAVSLGEALVKWGKEK
jgi:hypothetical protein